MFTPFVNIPDFQPGFTVLASQCSSNGAFGLNDLFSDSRARAFQQVNRFVGYLNKSSVEKLLFQSSEKLSVSSSNEALRGASSLVFRT